MTTGMPRHGAIRRVLSTLWLVLAFGALGLAGYEVSSGQWHATPVLSGSMRPALQPGDVVITQRVPISDLKVRDVLVFQPPTKGAHLTVHRIVKLTVKRGITSITTWGDANLAVDPMASSLAGTTAYRVVRVVPLVGYPAVWMQNGQRGLMIIGLGVILLITAGVTIMRPDNPSTPDGSDGSDGSDDPADPTAEAGEPVETAAG